jgi:Uma2 family endonuclease
MTAITIDTKLVGGMMRAWTPQLRLNLVPKARRLSDDDFFDFCRENSDYRIEMDKHGDIEIMPPTGAETGVKNFKLTVKFGNWAEKDGSGESFDSSTAFILPNSAIRSPDLSWMTLKKWNAISKEKRKKFAPACPDFVVELRSETDKLKNLQAKMEEYIENGTSLGWLIDAGKRKVYVYRPNAEVEILDNPKEVSGGTVLKGFSLKMKEIWG